MENKTLQFNKTGIALLLTAFSLGSSSSFGQLAASTYEFSAISGSYSEMTGGTSISSIQTDDALSGSLPIGFTFNYCGTDYTEIKASSNGWVTFSTTISTWTSANSNETYAINDLKPALWVLWEDLSGSGGTATYLTEGTAPNRIFTLQCNNWKWNYGASSASISYQVKLYETTNLIQYVYRQETGTNNSNSGGATIGILDNEATPGYLTLDNSSSSPTVASTFTNNITTRPETGQVYQWKPVPAIDMMVDSIFTAAPFCSNATEPVMARIVNQGTSTINTVDVYWQVDGVDQPPVTYSASAITNFITAPNNTASVTLGNVFFPDGTPKVIRAWTHMPNATEDMVPENDSFTGPISAALAGVEVHISPQDTTICEGTSITLHAGIFPNDPIYIWNNGSLDSTRTVSNTGTYSVKVQNDMGCFDYDTVSVSVYPNPQVNSIAIIADGSTITFNVILPQNVTSYTWDFDDGTIPQDVTGTPGQEIHDYTAPGEYTVTLTVRNQCGEVTVTRLVVIGETTGIEGLSALQKEINMYPNPSRDVVRISNKAGIRMEEVSIFNLMGQRVYGREKLNTDKLEVDISALASGIYNVVIGTELGKVTKKLEVIK